MKWIVFVPPPQTGYLNLLSRKLQLFSVPNESDPNPADLKRS